jgi:sulfur carrier protein
MQIQLNGELRDVAEGTTLSLLANSLDLGSSRYAIEVNEELIPRSEHPGHALQSGDRVEIVQAIGGG